MESIKEVLMKRDGMSSQDADDLIREATDDLEDRIADGDFNAAEDVCLEYFNLETDYIFDLIM